MPYLLSYRRIQDRRQKHIPILDLPTYDFQPLKKEIQNFFENPYQVNPKSPHRNTVIIPIFFEPSCHIINQFSIQCALNWTLSLIRYKQHMDKRGISNISSTDSFYFQLNPNHFKVDHGFAKNMKSGCTYRLVIYKGIQKIDEMNEGIKGKLIGGKIVFQQSLLSFYLPVFTPTRNIEFTVKVFETKPNQQEIQIAQHKIKSGDYIKNFKNDGNYVYKEQAQLLQNFTLVFDLFLHNSKIELDQIVKEYLSKSKVEERSRIMNNRMQTPKKNENRSEVSQSDASENSRDGPMFSSKKKLSRRRGHDGKMRSKHGSRENSEISEREGSVRSSKKGLGPFPHASKDQRFIHSPKKASPPKVNDSSRLSPKPNSNIQPKSQPTRPQNLVSVGRAKDSNGSEIGKLPQTPTKPTRVQSNIQRSQSAKKQSLAQRSSQILPTQTPVPSRRQPLSKRQEPSKTPFNSTSPRSNNIHNLEIKGNQKIFDIQHKKNTQVSKIERTKTDVLPPRNSTTRTPIKNNESPVKREEPSAKDENKVEITLVQSVTHNVVVEIPAKQPETVKQQTAKQPQKPQQRQQLQPQKPPQQEIPAYRPPQTPTKQQNYQPSAAKQGSVKSKGSQPAIPNIAIKGKQLADNGKPKPSTLKKTAPQSGEQEGDKALNKQSQFKNDLIFYVAFFILSAFLFYNAITPSRKV